MKDVEKKLENFLNHMIKNLNLLPQSDLICKR